ncbi:MAG: dipeptidase [Firmicutes bacterium]|jgi:membrane dipeptidase|nr:dipeptidase [Bacillota bacterium]
MRRRTYWSDVMQFTKVLNEIHKEAFIIDAHNDLAFDILRQRNFGKRKVLENDYYEELRDAGVNLLVSSLFIDPVFLPSMALQRALSQIYALIEDVEESMGKFVIVKDYNEIMEARFNNQIAILISFEGMMPIYEDLGLLRIFRELGVRLAGLTWARRNFLADGANYVDKIEGVSGGLTEFGVKAVKKCQSLGMVIDLSHINDEGFADVLRFTNGPFIASHSNARGIVDTKRNLSDEQIRAIAARKGVIGINAMDFLLIGQSHSNPIESIADHIDYIVNLVGIDYVGLGLDLNSKLMKYNTVFENENTKVAHKDVVGDYRELKKLTKILLKRKYDKSDICKIYGGNFLRVFKEVLK